MYYRFLHTSVIAGNRKLVKLVEHLAKQCNPSLLDVQNGEGLTALHLAVMHNNVALVQDLIQYNVKTFIQDVNGNTPLHIAITDKLSPKIIELLIRSGGNLDLENTGMLIAEKYFQNHSTYFKLQRDKLYFT